jgi:hypothetical protein
MRAKRQMKAMQRLIDADPWLKNWLDDYTQMMGEH